MDRFVVGQLVRVVRASWAPDLLGKVFRILEPQTWHEMSIWTGGGKVFGYTLDLSDENVHVIAPEETLEPVEEDLVLVDDREVVYARQ